MPFNGTGIFTRLYSWEVDAANDLNVDSTRMDTDTNDIADGLSNCITRDGQSPALANIPLGGYKITGLAAGTLADHAVNYQQVFTNPTFTGLIGQGAINLAGATSVTVPTATTGDNSDKAASTSFVQQAAFSAALPGQPGGTSPYYLDSTAGVASWKLFVPEQIIRSARTSNTVLSTADRGTLVDITGGTFTQTFAAAATLGNGWFCYLGNSGTGDITLDPNGGETIDGLASYIMYPGELRLVLCDGAVFRTKVINGFSRTWTATGPFTKPPGYTDFEGFLWNGGNSGSVGLNNSSGGGGGGCFPFSISANLLAANETITVGSGGIAVSTPDTTGNSGGASSIGTLLVMRTSLGQNGSSITTGQSNQSAVGFEASTGNASFAIYGGGSTNSGGGAIAANPIYGAGAGGSIDASGNLIAPSTSKFAGNGGVAAVAANGTAGTAPGGGGGATRNGFTSGAGARGEVRMRGKF